MEVNEEKRNKFMEYAGKRVNNVMHDIQILEPMARSNAYDFTKEDVEEMFNAMQETLNEAKEEFVMLALRTREGIDLKKYQKQFGVDLLEEKKEEIVELKNFIDIKDGHLVIKPKEFGKTNLIILKLI